MNDIKVKLEDVCERGSSNLAQKDLENLTGDYPVYGAGGYVKDIGFYHQENEYIAVVKDGAGIGRTVFLPEKSSVIGTLQYLLPKDNIVPKYLYYAVTSMKLEKYYTGATIPHIYFKDYKKEVLSLPNKNIQLEIVSILEKAEKIISYRKQQLEDFDNLIKSRFVEMFGDKKYQMVKAQDVCEFITKGTTPRTEEIVEEYTEDFVPYLKVYNLSFDGQMLFDVKPQFISNEIHNRTLARSKVYPYDVLMNIVGPPLGKFTLVPETYPEWNINQAIAIFRATDKVIPRFLLHALMQSEVLQPFIDSAVGIRQQNLSLEQCRNLEIPLPPIELQNKFANFVQATDKLKVKVQRSLDETQGLFNSLMQKYFD